MSSVLFETPGPKTVARHRLYSLGAWLLVAFIVAGLVWRMWSEGELAGDRWEPFVTPRYMSALLAAMAKTLQMAVVAILLALVFGTVFGIGKLSDRAWLRWPSWAVVEFFRAVPVLLLIFFIFFAYGVGDNGIGRYLSVVFALALYNGAVLAEVLRAGIGAVPKGQAEAAYAIGMRKTQVMLTVLLPQAVKIMLPAIISQLVVALKDTSLGFAISAPGLTRTGKQIYGEFPNQFQTAIVMAALYISMNLVLTWIATLVQKRFVGEKGALSSGGMATGENTGGGAGA